MVDAPQVCSVLAYAQQNNVEPFLEPVLGLAHALMRVDGGAGAAGRASSFCQLSRAFVSHVMCLLDLAAHPEPAVVAAAAQCVAQLVRMPPHLSSPTLNPLACILTESCAA